MTIPLENAFLCVNCDHISASATQCQCCASEFGLLSLANVLDRPARDMKLSTVQRIDEMATRLRHNFETYLQVG